MNCYRHSSIKTDTTTYIWRRPDLTPLSSLVGSRCSHPATRCGSQHGQHPGHQCITNSSIPFCLFQEHYKWTFPQCHNIAKCQAEQIFFFPVKVCFGSKHERRTFQKRFCRHCHLSLQPPLFLYGTDCSASKHHQRLFHSHEHH